jgi:hypothetical protein
VVKGGRAEKKAKYKIAATVTGNKTAKEMSSRFIISVQ